MLLLYLLRDEDLYGYQISQEIKKRSQGLMSITEGAMYPTLYRLTEQGYISDYTKQAGKRMTRVYYHMEDTGREYLSELLEGYLDVVKGIQFILDYSDGKNL